ncbi:P-Ser-HPr phosphatase [Levilactobacillus paucivorans]|uniref:p-Ser-HPr phosphatase n=2 Tax=Levilactobacillus paucivorans TaxID=616990 RepID=A0A0R2LA66_9LACO|nr:P-Ser-HPr phosphatase [Levilactobacillus paucivorans]
MMRYQHYFWDFDGTLVNTYPGMVRAFSDALVASGVNDFEIDTEAIYQAMRQHSVGTAFQRFMAEYQLDEERLRKIYQRSVGEAIANAGVFDGVADLLSAIVAAGGHNYLETHRDKGALDFLGDLGLADYFTDMVTADDHFPRKPDPSGLQSLLTRYDIDPKAAIMIGDRNLDIAAGHRAGMAGAMFDPEHMIVDESQPEVRVTRMAELQEWLSV